MSSDMLNQDCIDVWCVALMLSLCKMFLLSCRLLNLQWFVIRVYPCTAIGILGPLSPRQRAICVRYPGFQEDSGGFWGFCSKSGIFGPFWWKNAIFSHVHYRPGSAEKNLGAHHTKPTWNMREISDLSGAFWGFLLKIGHFWPILVKKRYF